MIRSVTCVALSIFLAAATLGAQAPGQDPSQRLREVLPADVADRVLARIAEARSRDLPSQALEQRALKFASRGVRPSDIESSVAQHSERMGRAKQAIEQARRSAASGDEIDAGAEAMRMGVDGAKIAELARSAPSGRSLAVPLLVVGTLVDRGLPSDEALQRVLERLQSRASDSELERMPGDAAAHRPAQTGRDLGATKRPERARLGLPPGAGPPPGVPGNAGKGARPTVGMPPGSKPATPRVPGRP